MEANPKQFISFIYSHHLDLCYNPIHSCSFRLLKSLLKITFFFILSSNDGPSLVFTEIQKNVVFNVTELCSL